MMYYVKRNQAGLERCQCIILAYAIYGKTEI